MFNNIIEELFFASQILKMSLFNLHSYKIIFQ